MKIVFCEDPLRARNVDEAYQSEADVVTIQGLTYSIVNFESLVNNANAGQAVARLLPEDQPTLGIYRGWMLTPDQYTELYSALGAKGILLINDPPAYKHCHHLPESYPIIEPYTPKSVWLPVTDSLSIDNIMACLKPFDSHPVIVKDYVKSQKHYWQEACFIPSAADRQAVELVVKRFLELQGNSLNEGLVFRQFVAFEPLTNHPKSGMPLSKEFRVFVLDGEPFYVTEYWEEGDYQASRPPLDQFRDVMRLVKSRFYTMDLAKRQNGEWMIVELGDAQVAGLPDTANIGKFYEALNARLSA